MRIVTDNIEIIKHQKLMEKFLHEHLPDSGKYKIGFPSGSWVAPVHYNTKIWYSTYTIKKKRNWNGFGISSELEENRSTNIVVEINTPLKEINRSVSGFFAVEESTQKVYLMHRGKIGGGRKGIGKDSFLQWYSNDLISVKDSDGENKDHLAIKIGEITSKNFLADLAIFVKAVWQFKQFIKSGDINESTFLSDQELKDLANADTGKPEKKEIKTNSYVRNPYISEYAKRRAKGKCQLCESEAPFKNNIGRPYLETHHVIWLSKGGLDTVENTVALCPNCHRKMHILNCKNDIEKLQK